MPKETKSSTDKRPPCLLLAGPTAVGKSEVAMLLAERFSGEIVSVDSMQVYRGMDIGTAKPSVEQMARVRHHLVDVVNPGESFDAAQFARLAHAAVRDTHARQRIPILCGGTGLYFRAFLEGLGKAPPASPQLRGELEKTPLSELLSELAARDPATFARIDRQNPRRVIRAVEVCRLSGRPFSEQRARWDQTGEGFPYAVEFFAICRGPEDLQGRIDTRVEQMFQRGLVKETEQLLGLAPNGSASQALGYRQVCERRPLEETIQLVKTRTRQFAKRQMTWFRRQPGIIWIEARPRDTPEGLAAVIVQKSAFFRPGTC